jgi:hypothetical protein
LRRPARGPGIDDVTSGISLDIEPIFLQDEPVQLRATLTGKMHLTEMVAQILPIGGGSKLEVRLRQEANVWKGELGLMSAGCYQVKLFARSAGRSTTAPLSDIFEVL